MGSEVLSDKWSGCMIFIYLVTSVITSILATGSLGLEKQAYNLDCNLVDDFCSSFTYALPSVLPHEFFLFIFMLTGRQGYCGDVLYHYTCIGSRSSLSLSYTGDYWHCVLYF
jgi:hypothetical protein